MGSTLTNTQPKDTYKSLLKTSDSTELSATAKYVSDGNGNDSPLALSTSAVGIGTASPAGKLEVNGSLRSTRAGVASQYVELDGGDAVGGFITNTGVGKVLTIRNSSTGSSAIFFDQTVASEYIFKQAGTQILRIDADGVKFGTDSAAANALDDYEEGTWTIVATPSSTGSITLDAGVNQGYYTKIGRQVTCTGLAEVSSVSSPTGTAVQFSVLPFAIAPRIAEYEMRIGGSVTYNGASILAVPYTGTETATFINVYIDASTVSAGNQFYFSFTYFV